MWKTVLFDLDGTLTDSAEGITKCVQYALEKMGKNVPELEDLTCFVGPPLKKMFEEYAGLTDEESERAVAIYRERYTVKGIFENRLYPHTKEMLAALKEQEIVLAVASSKPEIYVRQILEYFKIQDYFHVVAGSELGGKRVQKKEVLEDVIRRLNMDEQIDEIVLVGDTKYDVAGAAEVGIACVGVTYGYGSPKDFERENVVFVAETVVDVMNYLLKRNDVEYET